MRQKPRKVGTGASEDGRWTGQKQTSVEIGFQISSGTGGYENLYQVYVGDESLRRFQLYTNLKQIK